MHIIKTIPDMFDKGAREFVMVEVAFGKNIEKNLNSTIELLKKLVNKNYEIISKYWIFS